MNNTLVTLEDRELSAVRGGWGRWGCGGYGNGGYGDSECGYGFRRFGWGFHRFGFGDDDCGVETDFDIRPTYCATYVPVGDCD